MRTGVTARIRRRGNGAELHGAAHAVWEKRLIDTGVFYSIAADFIAFIGEMLHNTDVKAKSFKKN